MHKGSALHAACNPLVFGSEAHLCHLAEKPCRPPDSGPDTDPWVLHQGDCFRPLLLGFIWDYCVTCIFASSIVTPFQWCCIFLCLWQHLPTLLTFFLTVFFFFFLLQGFTPDKLPPSSCVMVPELNPPSPAKKFFTKMAKSLFGKKKSKGMHCCCCHCCLASAFYYRLNPGCLCSLLASTVSHSCAIVNLQLRRAQPRRRMTSRSWSLALSNAPSAAK